jgi:FkbM family methyltransferase
MTNVFLNGVNHMLDGRLTRLRQLRNFWDRNQPPLPTPWGFRLAGNPIMGCGRFEPAETAVVCHLLNKVDQLINVGANIGYYCCHALSLGKPMMAIEPIARNNYYLLRNLQVNAWQEQAEVFPVALGAKSSALPIWGGNTGASLMPSCASLPANYVTQVPVLPLDRVVGDALHDRRPMVLIDIEGAEDAVLAGAQHLLQQPPRPLWLVEITTRENQPADCPFNPHFVSTFQGFFNLGYRANKIVQDSGERVEITADDVQTFASGANFRLATTM